MNKKKLVVLTGAGISVESGIPSFRSGEVGLWNNHKVEDVATPKGFERDPEQFLNFYNNMHRDLPQIKPNYAHLALKELEDIFDVTIITQNVDDLHEKAGSSNIIHLHGELSKYCTVGNTEYGDFWDWDRDLKVGELGNDGTQVRPFIVLFNECVPNFYKATAELGDADMFLIIGTSLQVYPAASLIDYTMDNTPVYVIDPEPRVIANTRNKIEFISKTASEGMRDFMELVKK